MVHPMEGLVRYTSEERHHHANDISWCLSQQPLEERMRTSLPLDNEWSKLQRGA
jgi:hypothetical protein